METLRKKRYPMPKGTEAKTITMRELRGGDEILAALAADQIMTASAKMNIALAMQYERRESARLSIVEIDGVALAADDPKRQQIDDWGLRAWTAIMRFYGDLNGLPEDELGNCLTGAVDVTSAPSEVVPSTGK